MSKEDFTNREISGMFNELIERATRIEEQTIKTNGRVTKLELINSNKDGAFGIVRYILIFLTTILLGYLGWIGNQLSDIHNTLSDYEITIEQ